MDESPVTVVPMVSDRVVDHGARRLSFGAEAGAYARFRPTYPIEAIRWLLTAETVQVTKVLDVGAGTGALTTLLVAEGLDVTAVEPDAGMRDELAGALPSVSVLAGSAESVPLPDSCVDAVVAGQAWHWFEPGAAVAEFARVLVPGGILGLLWNLRDDSVPWVAALSDLIGGEDTLRAAREENNVAAALRTPASLESAAAAVSARFTEPERQVFAHEVSHTVDSLVGLVSTFSYVRLSPRRDEVLAAVRDLATTHPDLVGRDTFELPYVTAAYRSIRR